MSHFKSPFTVIKLAAILILSANLLLAQPKIKVTPDEFVVNVNEDQKLTTGFTIQNLGNSTLTYKLVGGPTNDAIQMLASDQEYHWRDSDHAQGPVFQWIDITSIGSRLPVSGDDQSGGPFQLDFPFPFYGTNYNSFYVCTNGFISFTSSSTVRETSIPSTSEPNALLAAFWDDLYSNNIYYHYDGFRVIIEFYNSYHYNSSSSYPYTFEIILHPSGKIVYQYKSMQGDLYSSAIGLENAEGTAGVQVSYYDSYLHDNMAIEFMAKPEWLAVNPASDSVLASGTSNASLLIDATDLPGGTYTGSVFVMSNDPVDSLLTLPVTLNVTSQPDLAVASDSMHFALTYIGHPETTNFLVLNDGHAPLTISSVTSSSPEYTPMATSMTIAAGDSGFIAVKFDPATPGEKSAVLSITCNDIDEGTTQIQLHGTAQYPPLISVAPEQITVDLLEGTTQTTALEISNAGQGELAFNIQPTANIPGLLKRIPATVNTNLQAMNAKVNEVDVLKANYKAAMINSASKEQLDCNDTKSTVIRQIKYDATPWQLTAARRLVNLVNTTLIKVAVVDGGGTYSSEIYPFFEYLNENWQDFGNTAIIIDYSTLNHENITYQDLVATEADVLIISDNYGGTSYDALSESECADISRYVQEGHGLYLSSGVFDNLEDAETSSQVEYFAPLVGVNSQRTYGWGTPSSRDIDRINILNPSHRVWNQMSNPYILPAFRQTCIPDPGEDWNTVVTDGVLLGLSDDNKACIVAKWNCVYSSIIIEDYEVASDQDYQLLYNIIMYTAQGGLKWVSVQPASGTIQPNSSLRADVVFDGSMLDQGTHYGQLILNSNDPDHVKISVPLTLNVTDNTAPGTVNDLKADVVSATFAMLSWSAPGDNGAQGTAESYLLRYSTQPINESNWQSAIAVADSLPKPASPGTQQGIMVQGLDARSIYYFALKTEDEAGGLSALSNVVEVRTPKIAEAVVYLPFEEHSGKIAINHQGDTQFNGLLSEFENLNGQDITPSSGWTQMGYKGSALKLDGENDYVSIPDYSGSPLHINTALALQIAVKPRTDILPSGSTGSYELISKLNYYSGYALRFNLETGKLNFIIQYNSSTSVIFESRKNIWFSGQWYNIRVTFDYYSKTENIKIYVDGQLDSTYRETRVLATNDESIRIGGGLYNYPFPGSVDEVMIHNSAIEPEVNHPPSSFELVFPANSARMDSLNFVFKWTAATDIDTGDVVHYKFYLSNDFRFTTSLIEQTLTPPSFEIRNGLVSGGVYFWKVVAYDENGGETESASVHSFITSFLATGIAETKQIPTQFAFHQNFPNPFNPSTTISYALPQKEHVTISIFNVQGQEQAILVEEEQAAGNYSVVWDGRRNTGELLPSGLYFCQIKAGKYTRTQKMSLLK